ncbi:hypothetical protein J21TS7_26870 [Paenibacillus cineris]|uniref:Uncharacterized protein n=1 Tax=Paenibacillus cineris TaxID=237530 RepID=A0ABQ4LCS5_9BACL|nr:hypothetical protein J21TS7_26870 [Paenibacillus cineris]
MVDRELRLPAESYSRFWTSHDPGAKNSHVQTPVPAENPTTERLDACKIREVQLLDLYVL